MRKSVSRARPRSRFRKSSCIASRPVCHAAPGAAPLHKPGTPVVPAARLRGGEQCIDPQIVLPSSWATTPRNRTCAPATTAGRPPILNRFATPGQPQATWPDQAQAAYLPKTACARAGEPGTSSRTQRIPSRRCDKSTATSTVCDPRARSVTIDRGRSVVGWTR
jgi:hypothetical protein